MQSVDLNHLRTWIGKEASAEDWLTPRLSETFLATFTPHLFKVPPEQAPLGIHWCLVAPTTPTLELTIDGHPPRGDFLPPVPLPRRMWAGSEVSHFSALPVGVTVTRRSKIMDVQLKSGRTGQLCIVSAEHEYLANSHVYVRERQSLVYREAPPPGPQGLSPGGERPQGKPALTWEVETTPALLFRYSALMFNAHRIHYDQQYTAEVEGYPGLVVQGPVQAGTMLNLAATLQGSVPKAFNCRGVGFLIGGRPFQAHAIRRSPTEIECYTQDANERVNMMATFRW